MPPSIPGFYWDESKGKYFKVQPGHLAPVGSKYSKDAIKKKQEEERKREEVEKRERQLSSWAPVKRKRHSTQNRYIIDRSIDSKKSASNASIWAQGLSTNSAKFTKTDLCDCSDSKPSFSCTDRITCLTWDSHQKRLLLGARGDHPDMQTDTPLNQREIYNTFQRNSEDESENGVAVPLSTTTLRLEATSISITDAGHVLTTTATESGLFRVDAETGWPKLELLWQRHFSRDLRNCYINASAARPGSSFDAAFGTDHGVCIVKDGNLESPPVFQYNVTRSETLSVGWLDHHVVAGACRNRSVDLFDTRSQASATRLKHSSAAVGLHVLDQTRLLIAGTENQMMLYDLRMTPLRSPRKARVNGRTRDSSFPLINYPGYENLGHDVWPTAVSLKMGIIAAAARYSGVKLFDLWHGNEVKPPTNISLATREPEALVRSLCFLDDTVDVEREARGPSLFIGKKHTVDEWTWD